MKSRIKIAKCKCLMYVESGDMHYEATLHGKRIATGRTVNDTYNLAMRYMKKRRYVRSIN